jgi:hypothetical protein
MKQHEIRDYSRIYYDKPDGVRRAQLLEIVVRLAIDGHTQNEETALVEFV